MNRYDVITVGAASRDIFLRSADFHVIKDPRFVTGQGECVALGSKIDIEKIVLSTGGGATNAAATFANFGFRIAFFGKVGRDENGTVVLEDLRRRGIATQFVQRDAREATALSVLLSTLHSGRTVLVYRGASRQLTPASLPFTTAHARWVYLTSLGGNLPLWRWIVGQARKHRMPIFANPGMAELKHAQSFLPILRHINILMLNREEANMLAHTELLSSAEVIRRLAKKLPGMMVVTDEARGAFVRAGDTLYHSEAHATIRVVERTGAGDAFGSGFLSGLLREKGDIHMALQYATANAESVLRKIGAKNGLILRRPTRRRFVRTSIISL